MSAASLEVALTRLAFDQPFFGTLLAMTPLIKDEKIATMATNGEAIYFNPRFVEKLSGAAMAGVLMHEIMHIVYLHCDRRRKGGRHHCGWNAACDFAINQEIKSWGFTLPHGALLDRKFQGMTAEGIYDALPEGGECTCGECHCRDILMPMPEEAREAVQGRIISSALAVDRGRYPEAIARWVQELKASRVPWERVLQRFLHEALGRQEQSWLPPDRRHVWEERYLPSTTTGRRGNLVVAMDTSSSIGARQLEGFAAELQGISGLCDNLLVLTCDVLVHQVVQLKELKAFLKELKFKGGGGTDFRPVFDFVAAGKLKPDALLYLTDAEGVFPKEQPRGYPVLWCLTKANPVPWGFSMVIRG